MLCCLRLFVGYALLSLFSFYRVTRIKKITNSWVGIKKRSDIRSDTRSATFQETSFGLIIFDYITLGFVPKQSKKTKETKPHLFFALFS
jgi:hypothetical protein